MKLVHLSDLHLGKRVNEFSMLEDQEYILLKIINIIQEERPEAVLLAGDIYDKSMPPAEAVRLFDDFLVRLSKLDCSVFVISGNHDSAERIAFGGRLMAKSHIFMSPVYENRIDHVTIEDNYGSVNFYMLPFIKPVHVRRYFPEYEIKSYNDALKLAVDSLNVDTGERNVIVSHQFVTGALRSDSEDINIGGLDNIDVSVFDSFDYVALGHIHRPQSVGRETVRYCGTPLKYSFSEFSHHKSVTVVDMGEKGQVKIKEIPLVPKYDMCEIKGSYNEITAKSFYENGDFKNDYLHITLTDEDDILDAISKLRVVYPRVMRLDYENTRTGECRSISDTEHVEAKSPAEIFDEFFEFQNNRAMSEEQRNYVIESMGKIWEGQK